MGLKDGILTRSGGIANGWDVNTSSLPFYDGLGGTVLNTMPHNTDIEGRHGQGISPMKAAFAREFGKPVVIEEVSLAASKIG